MEAHIMTVSQVFLKYILTLTSTRHQSRHWGDEHSRPDPCSYRDYIPQQKSQRHAVPGGQEEGEVTAIAKIGVKIKWSSCYFYQIYFYFLNSIVLFDFPFFQPYCTFSCGLIRVLFGVLWLPTWDLKEKDNEERSASEALSWHLSQGGSCMKTPMDNSRSYFKATAAWNRWEEDKEE